MDGLFVPCPVKVGLSPPLKVCVDIDVPYSLTQCLAYDRRVAFACSVAGMTEKLSCGARGRP